MEVHGGSISWGCQAENNQLKCWRNSLGVGLMWVNMCGSPGLPCQGSCPLECWCSLKSHLLGCLQNSLRRCWQKCQKNLLENVYHLISYMKVPAGHCTEEARRKARAPGCTQSSSSILYWKSLTWSKLAKEKFVQDPDSVSKNTTGLPWWVSSKEASCQCRRRGFDPWSRKIPHQIRSDQFSGSIVSDSLRPHESQHARPPCPSPTPGVHSDSCPSSQWCHPATSSSVVPFSSCPQSLPASQSFPMSQLFASGGQSTGVSALASFPSKEIPGLISFRMDWLDLLAVQGNLKSLLQHHSSKASILRCSAFFTVQLAHPYMTTGKTRALTRQTFFDKVMSLLLNMLSRLVITFLPRSKCLLISWLQSPSAVILEPKKRKSDTVSTVSPSIFPHLFPMKWWDQMPWSSCSECLALSQFFHLHFHFHQEAL